MIWLDLNWQSLIKRIKADTSQRPLLAKDSLENDFEKIYNERQIFYSEADLKVSIEDESPEEVVNIILAKLPEILIDPGDPALQQTTGL